MVQTRPAVQGSKRKAAIAVSRFRNIIGIPGSRWWLLEEKSTLSGCNAYVCTMHRGASRYIRELSQGNALMVHSLTAKTGNEGKLESEGEKAPDTFRGIDNARTEHAG